MNLKEELLKRGMTNQQVNSKIEQEMEAIIAEYNGDLPRDCTDSVEKIRKEIAKLSEKVIDATRTYYDLEHVVGSAEAISKALNQRTSDLVEYVIKDGATNNALLLYVKMLSSTVDIFGESKMTEPVMCKTIECASYAMWRSIMGEAAGRKTSKSNDDEWATIAGRRR